MSQQQQAPQQNPALTASRVIWFLPLLTIFHIAWYYAALPNPMASHFGPSGKADGFMSKSAFMGFYLGMTVFYTVLFGALGQWLDRIPSELINLPHKEYWLAPERRARTLQIFREQLAQFGIALGAFLLAAMQTTFLTNLRGSGQLDGLFFVYLIGFLVFTGIWTAQMLKQFRLPAD